MTDMGHRRLVDKDNKVVLVYRYMDVQYRTTPREHALAAAAFTNTTLRGDYRCEALLDQNDILTWSSWDNFQFSTIHMNSAGYRPWHNRVSYTPPETDN